MYGGGYGDLVFFRKGQFSHRRTRNVGKTSHGASFLRLNSLFDTSFFRVLHLAILKKHKFSEQENIICEFCKAKLVEQGSVLRRKWHQITFEVSAQFGKYVQIAFEASAQSWKWHQIAFEASAQFGKCLQMAFEASARFGMWHQMAFEPFARFGKCLQMVFEVSAQFGKYVQIAFEVSAQFGKCLQMAFEPFARFGKWLQITFEPSNQLGKRCRVAAEDYIGSRGVAAGFERSFKMKEIQSIALVNINNAAHFMFVSNMAGRAEKDAAVSEKCAAQVAALREAVKAEDENLQISAKSLTTDKIADADRLRDQLYAGYKKAVAGYVNFPMESLADAAKVLQQHIKDYKIDVKAQLDKETGLLVNFIQDLESKFAEQVKALSLGAFVEKLKAANEEVRELTSQRTDERSAKTAGALKAARNKREFLCFLSAMRTKMRAAQANKNS